MTPTVFFNRQDPWIWNSNATESQRKCSIESCWVIEDMIANIWQLIKHHWQVSAVWSNRHDDWKCGRRFAYCTGFLQRQLDKPFKRKGKTFWKYRNLGNLNMPSDPAFLWDSPPWKPCQRVQSMRPNHLFLMFLRTLPKSKVGCCPASSAVSFWRCAGCPRGTDERLGRRNPTDKVSYKRFGHVLHVSIVVSIA